MAKIKSKHATSKSVSRGRPPLAKSQKPTLSAKATRTLIRSHHTLRKAHTVALASNDVAKAALIAAEIEARGGLESYQLASTIGQSIERGGDSSKVLVQWLEPFFEENKASGKYLRMLEIGALSTDNACSRMPCLQIDRIDLHSQVPGIREVDFMDLPLPVGESKSDHYHIVSLSLVLNFVPDAAGRGEMLKRVPKFLQRSKGSSSFGSFGSCLFLVLPLPCIENARYMNGERLNAILESLGFKLANVKMTNKLYYSMWMYDHMSKTAQKFLKDELNPGKNRNNFCVVLK